MSNLPKKLDEKDFISFLHLNEITIKPKIVKNVATFIVESKEIADSFLELVNH